MYVATINPIESGNVASQTKSHLIDSAISVKKTSVFGINLIRSQSRERGRDRPGLSEVLL